MSSATIRMMLFLLVALAPWAATAEHRPSPFSGPEVSEQDLVQQKVWDRMSPMELQQEYEKTKNDISLMEKRLNQLRGETRLNQDQYREKAILDDLVIGKNRELLILEKLLQPLKMPLDDPIQAPTVPPDSP